MKPNQHVISHPALRDRPDAESVQGFINPFDTSTYTRHPAPDAGSVQVYSIPYEIPAAAVGRRRTGRDDGVGEGWRTNQKAGGRALHWSVAGA